MSRSLFAFFCVLLFCAESLAQHIPPCQGNAHSSPICWGYATGRAFNRSWSDSRCPLSTLNLGGISDAFFDFISWNPASVRSRDIIKFGSNHAAYVHTPGGTIGTITVDQYSTMRTREETNIPLQQVIDEHGPPTDICRKKPLWQMSVQNSFTGGKVEVENQEYDAPFTLSNLYWETTVSIDAVMDGRDHQNYMRRFEKWEKGGGFHSSSKATSSTLTHYSYSTPMNHTAYLWREFDITFQNSLPGASGGQIKIGSPTYTAPKIVQVVEVLNPNVTAEGLYQVINHIEYTFSSWSPGGSTSASTTFYPGDHTTYTASFSAKPQPPPGVSAGGSVGSYVQVTWSDHPHQQVTQYQIWRKVKKQNQNEGPPVLLTTVSRGTTSYTDYEYLVTDGYTNDLVWYDVRSYFSINGTYSDPNWIAVFARQELLAKREISEGKQPENVAVVPLEYEVASYPNPFNPSTTIRYTLPHDAQVKVGVYDLMGREIARLVDAEKNAGMYQVVWHGVDERGEALPSGIYLVRMTAQALNGNERIEKTKKIVMMK